jgi:hypothetical protein
MSANAPLDLSAPPPIPEAARDRVAARLASGRLHRYGEGGGASGRRRSRPPSPR